MKTYWQRRARLAEKQYSIAVNALEQISKVNIGSRADLIKDIAHDALGKIDVLTAEHEKETA